MSTNTIPANQQRDPFAGQNRFWLFGYGSLIYKVDFPVIDARPASISGWERRFWQGSHDHRGTALAPGRVVTLVQRAGAICDGMAYRVDREVLGHLDHREKNGYLRFATTLAFADGASGEGLVYIATEDNEAYLGPAPEIDIARQIQQAAGPSGANAEYLLNLAAALRDLDAADEHVFSLEAHLQRLASAD